MPDQIVEIPIDQIDDKALERDRTSSDAAQFEELWFSILKFGLRQPIEVYTYTTPIDVPYALISGARRLAAFRHLHQTMGLPKFASIPTFIREPTSRADAMVAMVQENDIRAELSPWERARIAVVARDHNYYPTIDAAIEALYPNASRQKHQRLRSAAAVVEEFAGLINEPSTLSERRMERLAMALRAGFGDLICHILRENRGQKTEAQWAAIAPTLKEAEDPEPEIPATATSAARPRRLLVLRQGLTIRREYTPDGWLMRFSGPEAKRGGLMDDVMDLIEYNCQKN